MGDRDKMDFNSGRRSRAFWEFPHSADKFLDLWLTEIQCRYITHPDDDFTADNVIILAVGASTYHGETCGGGILYFPESKIGRCYQINFLNDLGIHIDPENTSQVEMLNLLFSMCLFKQTLVNRKTRKILCDNVSIRLDKDSKDPIVLSTRKIIDYLEKTGTNITNDPNGWYDFRPRTNDLLEQRLIGAATAVSKGFPVPVDNYEYKCFVNNSFYMVKDEMLKKYKHLFCGESASKSSENEPCNYVSKKDQIDSYHRFLERRLGVRLYGESLRYGQWEFSFTPDEFFKLKYSKLSNLNTQYPDEYEMILAVDASGKLGSKCGGGGVLLFPRLNQALCYQINFLNHLNVHIDHESSAEMETLNMLFSLCLFKQALINQKKLKILCDNLKLYNDKKECPIVYSIRKILMHLKDTGTEIHNIDNYYFLPRDLLEQRLVGVADILSKGRVIPEFKDDYQVLQGNEFSLIKEESFKNYANLFTKTTPKDSSESCDSEESSGEEATSGTFEDYLYHTSTMRRRRNHTNNCD